MDSRSRNLADGGLEQRQQTKQLEVFQASIPGGSLQVIRSQSVTSTSSSWHGQSKVKPVIVYKQVDLTNINRF